MSALVFLGIAAAISALGLAVLWYLNRPPRSIEEHMEEFHRQIRALSPETGLPGVRPRRGGRNRSSAQGGRRSG